ncbi:MAG: diguanylate cyclase, partial [Magnetovibrio sp.]|nr:diguanylate cyclase [Magnetovibrio sp.]
FMGGSIAGMHYVAMEAAYFIPIATPEENIPGFAPTILAVGIGVVTALIMLLAFVSSLLGKYMENMKLLEKRTDELRIAMHAAEDMARTDALTGMNNRLAFFEQSDSIHKMATRHNHIYAVILFDIDFFKKINDTYGHQIGDEALKALAKVVLRTVRETDVAGRIGGEEFAIILPETTHENASLLAARLRQNISEIVIQKSNANVTFTASFGIACHSQKDDRFEDIMEWSDQALYQAKETGRNKVVSYYGCCEI